MYKDTIYTRRCMLRALYIIDRHMFCFQYTATQPDKHFAITSSPTAPISRSLSPPLLKAPCSTIKRRFPQLYIHFIMRFTHPPHQPSSPSQLLPIKLVLSLCHPRLKIFGAVPARVKLTEKRQELFHVGLLGGGGGRRVGRRESVEERPGRGAETFDIGRTVGGESNRG